MARGSDEADGGSGRERGAGDDVRLEVGQVAVHVDGARVQPDPEPDAAPAGRLRPGREHDGVGQRVERRPLGRRDVGGGVVVVRVGDRDSVGTASDGEDVAVHRARQAGRGEGGCAHGGGGKLVLQALDVGHGGLQCRLAPRDRALRALLVTLDPGVYTVIGSAANGTGTSTIRASASRCGRPKTPVPGAAAASGSNEFIAGR